MLGFFRDFSGFHTDWSVLFRLEMDSVKLSLRILCRAALSLWLALLYFLRSEGACVLCQVALDFLLSATRRLMAEGIFLG